MDKNQSSLVSPSRFFLLLAIRRASGMRQLTARRCASIVTPPTAVPMTMPVIVVMRVVRVVSSMVIINFVHGTVMSVPLENSTDHGCRGCDCRSEQRNCGKHSQRFKCDTHASGSFVRLCPRTTQHPRIDGEGSAIVARFMLHPSIPQSTAAVAP